MSDATNIALNATNVAYQDKSGAEAFGLRLQCAVLSKGLKKNDIYEIVGIKRQTWSNYWEGKRICDADKIFTIADCLGISARWLATGEGKMGKPDEISDSDAGEWRLIGLYRSLPLDQRKHLLSTASMLWDSAVHKRMRDVSGDETLHDPQANFRGEGDE